MRLEWNSALFLNAVVHLLIVTVDGFSIPAHTTARVSSSAHYSSTESFQEDDEAIIIDENDDESSTVAADTEKFESLGLSTEILSAVASQGNWHIPTPVQRMAIPAILSSSSNDSAVWCEAPTGSGKTAAYALPLLQKLYKPRSSSSSGAGTVASMVLCPTRELAVQIGFVISQLTHNVRGKKNWNVVVLHGGIPLEPQIVALSNAARNDDTIDVLVATPGRLVDVFTYYDTESAAKESALERRLLDALDRQGKVDSSLTLEKIQDLELDRNDDDGRSSMRELLRGLEYLVIDEADRLLSKAFVSEIDACLELLTSCDKKALPTWLFSATFPKAIEPRVAHVLKQIAGTEQPIRIACTESDRIVEQDISASLQKKLNHAGTSSTVQQKIGPASTIELRSIRLDVPKRTQALRKLLETHTEWDRVLVFVATRYASEHVARKLRRVGIESAELHGKLDQEARIRRLKSFSKGRVRVLLATDVAARGLDIAGLPAVVNYDLPRSTENFIHRVGRVGRAGCHGTAVSFVTPQTEAQLDLIEKRHLSKPIDREVLEGFEPDEAMWQIQASASHMSIPGVSHSSRGLAHDKMNGGIKGRRKSKKDRLRERAARSAAGASSE